MEAKQKINLYVHDDEIEVFKVEPEYQGWHNSKSYRYTSMKKNQEINIDLGDGTTLFIERCDNSGTKNMDENIDFKGGKLIVDTDKTIDTPVQYDPPIHYISHGFIRNAIAYLESDVVKCRVDAVTLFNLIEKYFATEIEANKE